MIPLSLDKLKGNKVVCLTLDVERDYGDLLGESSYEGLSHIHSLVSFLKERDVPLTCFVQGSIFDTHPSELEKFMTLNIEFELHSYSHPKPKESRIESEIEKGGKAYINFMGKAPLGYRSPLGVISEADYQLLIFHNFKFDSSVFPSIRPGVYNNLGKPTMPYLPCNHKIVEFPFAVLSKIIRVPVCLSYVNLLGWPYWHLLKTFELPDLIIFNFHLHDLFKLNSSNKLPLQDFSPVYKFVFQKIYLQRETKGLELLGKVISLLRNKGYTFATLVDVYNMISEENSLWQHDD
jgi:peptidoglycan/xylan/chitin deacetylase (PgdA/CDA1 family)